MVLEEVMREELDQFLGVAWGECSPKRKGFAMVPIPAIWLRRRVDSKRSMYPETVKASSTRRSLNATVAMNPISQKD